MEIMPMMPYEFQEVEWRALEGIIEECLKPNSFKAFNYVAEKSRDMTWSWTMCMLSLHRWQFRNSSILIGSRKEDEVDTSGDMDTPFEKIRFQLLRQPDFLVPRGFDWRKHSKHMHLINPNGGEITGESANPNFGRGGRKLFVWFDEFAFWDHDYAAWRSCSQTTNLRIAVSTPNGPNNKFARLRHGEEQENVIVRTSPWYLHPLKSQGLEMWNGKYTSPWYREQKSRMSAEDMAREIDISYASSIKGWVFDNYGAAHRAYKLKPVPDKTIIVALDPGIYFGALIGQVDHYNRVLLFKEFTWENAHLKKVAEDIKKYLWSEFNGFPVKWVGDPSGAYRLASGQEMPEYTELDLKHGIKVTWQYFSKIAPVDRVPKRIAGIKNKMSDFVGATNGPGFLVDYENCPLLDKALAGEYRRKVTEDGQVKDEIDERHPYEDVVDCAGYLVLSQFPFGFEMPNKSTRHAAQKTTWGFPSGGRR